MHHHPDNQVCWFPPEGWMLYLNAGLLCEGWLVTKKQDCHINTAATATTLQDTIIKDSKRQDPTIATEWTEDTFKSVDWQANGSSFKALTPGQHLQISKYAHEWTPTMHHWAQISNKIDQWCFACGHLKENVQHMLLCPSGCRQAARSKAINKFCTHLSWYHTPAWRSNIILTHNWRQTSNDPRFSCQWYQQDDSQWNSNWHQNGNIVATKNFSVKWYWSSCSKLKSETSWHELLYFSQHVSWWKAGVE
jgi:hypothetical protein